ncbi:MAG: PilZ domain-containing protein [Planctomycetota bacterium]|nr:PilZ domain-containing protein [Planctomycetota bacterium]
MSHRFPTSSLLVPPVGGSDVRASVRAPLAFVPGVERRRFERFAVPTAYRAVALRPIDDEKYRFEGRVIDLSEGGVCFELDRAIEPGVAFGVQIIPTTPVWDGVGPGRAIFAIGRVVWCAESESPGKVAAEEAPPARLAIAFTNFATEADRARVRALGEVARVQRRAA